MIYISFSLFYILKVFINKQIEINCNSFFSHDANIANSGLIQRWNLCLYILGFQNVPYIHGLNNWKK